MSECVDVWQMNNTFGNLQVEEGTFHQYTSLQNGRTNGESEKYVEIIEEPLTDGYRFRYENEGRNAGPIKGVNSKGGHTTHPTIKIHGHRGPAYIIVSLITIHGLYPHPHKLVGEDCKDGIFRKLIDVSEMPYCFSDLRIQCVKKKKKEVEESLKERERRRIDPFATGFSHLSDLSKINFNAVRLCFQVLLPDSNGNFEYPVLLNPAISKHIYDSKSASNLSIMKLSHCSASVEGKKEIILLCGQIDKDDIEIIFYEEKDKEIIWTGYGDFSSQDIHYRVAISFKTPAYKTLNVHKPINCFIYLRRISDGTMGRPREFTLLPIEKDPEGIRSKRRKFYDSSIRRDFQSNNVCSPKPDDVNLRVKKGEFEIRRNNEKVHCTPRTIQTTVRKDAMHNNVHCTPRTIQTAVRKNAMHNNGESTPRAMQNTLRKEVMYENGFTHILTLCQNIKYWRKICNKSERFVRQAGNVHCTPRTIQTTVRKDAMHNNVHCTPRTIQTTVRKDAMHKNVHCTPRTIQTAVRKNAMHNNVESTPRAMQNTLRKEVMYENVGITSKSTLSPIRESSLRPETSYETGTVNNFCLICNPGSAFDPLPSTSVLGNGSYVQNGPLVCYNPEKHASAMSQDQMMGAPSLGLPPNTQQHVDNVYPADFENSQLNKPIAFGDPRESDKKMLSKDVYPNQNDSNENASSSNLDSDDIISGFNTIFDIIYGLTGDEQMAFENNFGVLPNSDADDSTDDEQMSIQNNVGVLENSDTEDSADYCLDRLSNLSLETNSKDPDVTMRDVSNHSFSEAVGISILVSS